MLKHLFSQWPVIQQIKTRSDGTGPEAWSDRTQNLKPKTAGCDLSRGVCPYCGVGCGQLVYHKDGKLVSIEGDPASPISRGHLCPKGAGDARSELWFAYHLGRMLKERAARERTSKNGALNALTWDQLLNPTQKQFLPRSMAGTSIPASSSRPLKISSVTARLCRAVGSTPA